jgi:glutamate carboxypeptidase
MDTCLGFARSKQREIVALIRELVECESPSDDARAVNRFVELIAARVAGLGKVVTFSGEQYGRQLQCQFKLPGVRKQGQILVLGHSDTVWPVGTIRTMPFREADGRLWGPGVLDMKSGIAFLLYAVQALRELDIPVRRTVILQLNSEEEIGSPNSRGLTENAARASNAVLVLEPGTGLEGRLKTARKGVGVYRVEVKGLAAHAGVDFTAGASAIVELAKQVDKISRFTKLGRGLTVNAGVISGGTRSNVVAAEAAAEVDFRVAHLRDAGPLDRRFRALKPFDRRCSLTVTGGLNRPPMERTAGGARLFRTAKALARDLGIELEESMTGGGSDGNFTAALGVPTLDGLGGVGEGAHAPIESILVDRIADRTALIARLLTAI